MQTGSGSHLSLFRLGTNSCALPFRVVPEVKEQAQDTKGRDRQPKTD